MNLKQWLNERPGAAIIEAEEAAKAPTQPREVVPFDPRTEVSADAKAIIKHLTLLLFWVPVLVVAILAAVYLLDH